MLAPIAPACSLTARTEPLNGWSLSLGIANALLLSRLLAMGSRLGASALPVSRLSRFGGSSPFPLPSSVLEGLTGMILSCLGLGLRRDCCFVLGVSCLSHQLSIHVRSCPLVVSPELSFPQDAQDVLNSGNRSCNLWICRLLQTGDALPLPARINRPGRRIWRLRSPVRSI